MLKDKEVRIEFLEIIGARQIISKLDVDIAKVDLEEYVDEKLHMMLMKEFRKYKEELNLSENKKRDIVLVDMYKEVIDWDEHTLQMYGVTNSNPYPYSIEHRLIAKVGIMYPLEVEAKS